MLRDALTGNGHAASRSKSRTVSQWTLSRLTLKGLTFAHLVPLAFLVALTPFTGGRALCISRTLGLDETPAGSLEWVFRS
jgi:hypothetical protein